VEIQLYEGSGTSGVERSERFRPLERSLLMRVQTVRAETTWMRARLALAEADGATDSRAPIVEAARLARRLLGEGLPQTTVWGHLVRAAVLVRRSRAEAAAELREAIAAAEKTEMLFCAAAARLRLASLIEGAERGERQAEAEVWIES